MWLPLMLLALMASGSACPDPCVCHQGVIVDRDSPIFVDVMCRGRAPAVSEIPANTRRLFVAGVDEYEVANLLEEMDAADTSNFESSNSSAFSSDGSAMANATSNGSNDTAVVLSCLDELTMTNCSLTYVNVSWDGLRRVRTLNLSRNNLARLEDVRTSSFTGLTCLDLSENSLRNASAGVFRTLAALMRLNLRRNELAAIDQDAFRGLDRLECLDLSDNRLTDLPDSALTPLYSLQKLDLSGNQLQVLGAKWFESLDKLRELDVSRNGLAKAASGTLQPLPGLSVLKLSENPLKERDVSLLLGTGKRLETVDASRTGLARVPVTLTRSVRALRLAGNKLTTIRSGDLDSYPLLRMLDISDNRLVEIEDDALGRLEVLEELDASGNALTKIPGSLPSSLTLLKLHRNAIVAVDFDDLQGLCNLRSLTLEENRIDRIDVGALARLALLTDLDLSDNPIEALPTDALGGPSNLATLRMSGLTMLRQKQQQQGDMAFPVPTPERLLVLDVSRSPVLARQLLADDAALSACKSLLELNLAESNLTTLRSDLAYLLPQLRRLDLSGNDWNCTEELHWLGEWTRQHGEPEGDGNAARCASPEETVGRLIRELPSPRREPSSLATTTLSLPTDERFQTTREIEDSPATPTDDRTTEEPTTISTRAMRIYEAPTSFENVTAPIPEASLARKNDDDDDDQSTTSPGDSVAKGTTRSSDGSNGNEEGENFSEKPRKKMVAWTSKLASAKTSKVASHWPAKLGDKEDEEKRKRKKKRKKAIGTTTTATMTITTITTTSTMTKEKKSSAHEFSIRSNNLTKDNLAVLNGPLPNTIAEELNSRAMDSGARVSEPLSGAHPGMLILAAAALGAATVLTVVLSRRATVRRRDRYHRHENIEVHTLTPSSTELW